MNEYIRESNNRAGAGVPKTKSKIMFLIFSAKPSECHVGMTSVGPIVTGIGIK